MLFVNENRQLLRQVQNIWLLYISWVNYQVLKENFGDMMNRNLQDPHDMFCDSQEPQVSCESSCFQLRKKTEKRTSYVGWWWIIFIYCLSATGKVMVDNWIYSNIIFHLLKPMLEQSLVSELYLASKSTQPYSHPAMDKLS